MGILTNLFICQIQVAIVWMPIVITVAVVVALIGGGAALHYIKKGKKIAVLGMKEAGKTQMLANMRGMTYDEYEATLEPEKYNSFEMKLGDRTVKIAQGKDIGGGVENIKSHYLEMIKDNEIIFFLFNAHKYMYDENPEVNGKTYRENTQGRFDFIYDITQELGKETVIIGTFRDKFNKDEDAYTSIKKTLESKPYAALLKNNFTIINMQNKAELEKVLTKLFNKS